MRRFVKALAPVLDLVCCPLILIFSPVAYVVATLRGRAPLSRAILDKFGIGIIRHHYTNHWYLPEILVRSIHPGSGLYQVLT